MTVDAAAWARTIPCKLPGGILRVRFPGAQLPSGSILVRAGRATQANTENAPSGRIRVARAVGGRVGDRSRDARGSRASARSKRRRVYDDRPA
jgi:hypothetical protein